MTTDQHKPLIAVSQVKIGPAPVQAVEGRDLHAGLGVRKDFTNWAKQQVQRLRLMPERDYLAEVFALQGENSRGGRPETRYWFALDAAKHIAMMANTERGFEVREYFLECERRAMGQTKAARIGPDTLPERPFDEWTLEEIRTNLAVVNAYRHTLNNASAGWVLQRLGFPKPPARLLPAWWQAEFDVTEPRRGTALTITVPFSGEAH